MSISTGIFELVGVLIGAGIAMVAYWLATRGGQPR